MALLQELAYDDYKYALTFNKEQCEVIASLANLRISFQDSQTPGQLLMKHLYRAGYSVSQYKKLLTTALNTKTVSTYYKPNSKVAILIANERYNHLSNLATPSTDCDSLATELKTLGFICVIIKNTTSDQLKTVLKNVVSAIPRNSYCFIFYAGHGCEIINTKCIIGVSCPNDIQLDHCVTENYILREVARCKPELCLLIMDMCRIQIQHLNENNQNMYNSMFLLEDYTFDKNLLVVYTTQTSQAAYEVLEIECSTTIDYDVTYELKTGDTGKITAGASQYVNALCSRLADNCDISALLDKVHLDIENSIRKQRPIKVQCGVAKRSLYDPAQGDAENLMLRIKETVQNFEINCTVL